MGRRLQMSRWRWLSLGLLLAGLAALLLWGFSGRGAAAEAAAAAQRGVYGADEPLAEMPQRLLPGMILLSAEQMVKAPLVDGFQSPIGTRSGALSYDAQPFGTLNEARGGHHTGADLNGIGGQNSDEGDPVYAAGRGLVVFSGHAGPGWGEVVVLAHRLPGDARVIQTLYGHLASRCVHLGQLVGRGDLLGTIGTGDGAYLAHLHFEVIASRCTEAGQPAYAKQGVMNRLDPQELLTHYPAPPVPDPYTSVRRLRLREAALQQPAPAAELPQGAIPVQPTRFF
ncbi:MAG: M23 family metallopeptidase [Akkermansia sp.]